MDAFLFFAFAGGRAFFPGGSFGLSDQDSVRLQKKLHLLAQVCIQESTQMIGQNNSAVSVYLSNQRVHNKIAPK